MTDATRRFPAALFSQGSDPDARFSLANERTFLAWIRTSLALIASGVALEALGLNLQDGLRLSASIVLIVAGIAAPVQAWFGWMQIERALRLDRPLPAARLAFPIGAAVSVAGILVFLGGCPRLMAGGAEDATSRSHRPFDAGLQPERTALAWRRTALAVAVGSLAALRILPEVLGSWALIPAALGAGVSFVALVLTHRRYRRIHTMLTSSGSDRVALSGGALPALMAVATFGGGIMALVAAVRLGEHLAH